VTEPNAPMVSFSVSAADVQRAIESGKPVTVDHPEALALAAAGARGIPRKRVTPTTVGIIGGETTVEINPRLTQYDWFGSYGDIGFRDRMPREWDTAQAIRNEWTLAVMERDWQIKPVKGGDKNDLLVAQFYRTAIEDHYRGGEGGMDGLIGQFAPLAWNGVIPSQPYFPHDRSFTMKDDAGKVVMEGAQFLQMAPVGTNTIQNWLPEYGPDGSVRYGLRLYQQTTDGPGGVFGRASRGRSRHLSSGSTIDIPAQRIIQARYLPNGDDPAPYGLGRALWFGYKASESLNKFLLQGAEKAAFGIPQIVIGPEASEGERATVNQLVANLRVGAIARFSLPDGYSVVWHEVPWSAKEILDALTLLQKAAHRATNTQHLFTGSDNGTQSLHGSQTKAFHTGVNVVCKAIVQALSQGPVDTAPFKQLGVLNFKGLRQFPSLTFGPPPVVDVKTWMDGVSAAVSAGVLTPDGGVEASVRDVLQLDEMPPETLEMWRAKIENESVPDVNPANPTPRVEDDDEPDPKPPTPTKAKAPEADEGGEEADKMEAGAKPAPVAAAEASPRGVVLMAYPDAAGREALGILRSRFERDVGPLEDKGPAHVTLLYLGKGLSGDDVADLRAIAAGALSSGSLSVDVVGVDTFPATENSEGRVPVILRIQSDALSDMHDRLLRRTTAINRQNQFDDYLPHMTLGYWTGAEPPTLPKTGVPKTLTLERVALVVGDDEVDSFGVVAAADLGERSRFDRMLSGPRGRPVRPIEEVVALSETTGQTSLGKEVVSGILLRWRDKTAALYGELVENAADSLGDVATIPVPNQRELIEELTEALRTSYRSGVRSVERETARLEASPDLRKRVESGMAPDVGEPGTVAPPVRLSEHSATCGCGVHAERLVPFSLADRMALAVGDVNDRLRKNATKPVKAPTGPGPEMDIDPEDSIESVARTTTAAEAARMKQAAMRSLQSAGTGGALPGPDSAVVPGAPTSASVSSIITNAIRSLSDGVERNQAQADVNTIFGLGRNQQAVAQGSERFVFSNLVESDTCGPCEEFDGQVFGLEQMDFFATPFSQCKGGDMCGCLVIAGPVS